MWERSFRDDAKDDKKVIRSLLIKKYVLRTLRSVYIELPLDRQFSSELTHHAVPDPCTGRGRNWYVPPVLRVMSLFKWSHGISTCYGIFSAAICIPC